MKSVCSPAADEVDPKVSKVFVSDILAEAI